MVIKMLDKFENPFRPGAGHKPPYLAGRRYEQSEFEKLLQQTVIMDNLVLTGLRGVGKTVLADELKPIALREKWLWAGTDLSESASITEENLARRIITDLSVVTSGIIISEIDNSVGFTGNDKAFVTLGYNFLCNIYDQTPGLTEDKLKAVFQYVAPYVKKIGAKGIIFSYDEAQNLTDHSDKDQFPLSILLDVFQSIQKQGIPFMLVLVGLPTLFPKLVESRTYTERMFRVLVLDKLSKEDSIEAIEKPVTDSRCPLKFTPASVERIYEQSSGYPYFIQFICREVYDSLLQRIGDNKDNLSIPIEEITRKLDTDFFAGRWARVTDRQQDLLHVIASLDHPDQEFTIQEIVLKSKEISNRPFSNSHVNQMLNSLISAGLIYRDRHGKYLFAVPMMGQFILRTKNYQFQI